MSPDTADVERFMASLRAPEDPASFSPGAMARALDLTTQRFARLAGVHQDALSNSPQRPELQQTMFDIVRVLSAAADLCGSVEQAIFWFRNQPIDELRHFTAMELVEQGRAQAVVDYIEATGTGAIG
jgi:hypothetical protein